MIEIDALQFAILTPMVLVGAFMLGLIWQGINEDE